MEFKGSKGKWNIERHQHQLCGDYLIIDENDYQLAIADNEYLQDYEKTKANALLISKAPEMLELLQSLVSSEMTPLAIRKQAKQLIKEHASKKITSSTPLFSTRLS